MVKKELINRIAGVISIADLTVCGISIITGKPDITISYFVFGIAIFIYGLTFDENKKTR